MKRKVQAQRKFAQGAFIPQNHDRVDVPPAKEPTENKRTEKDIIFNKMSPSRLLDYVSFGTLKVRDARVMVERLQDHFLNRVESSRNPILKPRKINKIKKTAFKKKEILIRRNVMRLRSQSVASRIRKLALKKRPLTPAVVIVPKKKRVLAKPSQSSVSGFSSDDDTPLNLINQNKILKRPIVIQKKKKNNFLRKKLDAKTILNLRPIPKEKRKSSDKIITIQTQAIVHKEETAKTPVTVAKTGNNEPDTLSRVLAVASQAFYNENEIERWIVDSTDCVTNEKTNEHTKPKDTFKVPQVPLKRGAVTSARPAAHAPSAAPEVAAHSDAAASERPPSPCPSVQFSSIESIQSASQKDLDNCCKKCHNCQMMTKFFKIHSEKAKPREENQSLNDQPSKEESSKKVDGEVASSVVESAAAVPSDDVYDFDETDNVREQPTLSKFRADNKKNTRLKNKRVTRKRFIVDVVPKNGSQVVRCKMPNGPEPIMKVSLMKPNKKSNKNVTAPVQKKPSLMKHKHSEIHETVHKNPEQNKKTNTADECLAGPSKPTNKDIPTKDVDKKDTQSQPKQTMKKGKGKATNADKDAAASIPKSSASAKVLEAPVLYPTEKEFENPLKYIQKITPAASNFGICKIVPPKPHLKPECYFEENTRFEVTNQYPGRMFSRWGPATRDLCAIRSHLATAKVEFTRPPLIDSLEVDIPKLFNVVQANGGLSSVLAKKKWNKVAEDMGWEPKPSLAKRLDQLYVKFLLPYDTLNNRERQVIQSQVEKTWTKRYKKMLFRARNPLYKQLRELAETSSDEEEEEAGCVSEVDDCVVRGRAMNLSTFKRIATNAMQLHFSGLNREPTLDEVLDKYWRLVLLGSEHVCVNAAAVDTGDQGYGFPKGKGDPYSKHPWNPKVLSSNPGSVLRSLGPVIGVTVPTLHLGMVFSTSCWHRDPHGLPWIEYMHEGPPKIWYGISDDQSDKLRAAVENLCPEFCQNKSIWLASDITMIPPNLLAEQNVSLSKLVQNPGEFVVIFPKAFSSSICSGFTISESVYYAPLSWLTTVQNDFQEVRDSCEPTMFPLEQLLLALVGDARAPQSVLAPAFRALDDIVRQEIENRTALVHMGYEAEVSKSPTKKKHAPVNMHEASECDICRSTLFLSKVVGVASRSSAHCVLHARLLLQSARAPPPPDDVTLTCYYSEDSLNDAVNRMRQRLFPAAEPPTTTS